MASNHNLDIAKISRYFHLAMLIVWVGLSVPGIIYWKDSILFVIICSLYANIESSFSAYQAARAERSNSK